MYIKLTSYILISKFKTSSSILELSIVSMKPMQIVTNDTTEKIHTIVTMDAKSLQK